MPYKMPIASYSMLNTDKICGWQMYRRYIVKDIAFVETEEIKFGNRVHTAFEYRLSGKRQLPDDMRQWEHFCTPLDAHSPQVEQWFGLRSDGRATGSRDADVWFRGKVDTIIFDITTWKRAIIYDWKTSKKPWEDPFELEVSALLLKAKYPQLEKISGAYVWLTKNKLGEIYDLSDVSLFWNKVYRQTTEIERKLANGTEFEKTPGPLCGWCSVGDCEFNKNDKLEK